MLSFELDNVIDDGPQHSTPVKESFLNKTQRGENSSHPSKTGRIGVPRNVKVNGVSYRYCGSELHRLDLNCKDSLFSPDDLDSIIDISKISEIQNSSNIPSVHNNDISDTLHGDDNTPVFSEHDLVCPDTHSSPHAKQTPGHQNKNSPSHESPSKSVSFKHNKLENGNAFDRHNAARSAYTGSQYNRAQPSDCFSDSDLSKQSTPPKTTLSYIKVALSPSKQRLVRSYRRVRSNSFPRILADANVCNSVDYAVSASSMSDFRRTPAIYIEQDVINKQRQEIQLLMEELGNRDQELNDLVNSHQKQVKAWESDNEKLVALQARLSQYEEELRTRENQLQETLSEMARVNEQREVDAVELKQTQNEMIKLAERIMENSLYIKEMEAQNQKLSFSLRDFVTTRQSFDAREQELLLLIEEKDISLTEKQREMQKMAEHIKYLECQCEQLGERNNNTAVESVNWRKKYYQVKEEADRLSAECRQKEENVQKITQQLHESLQQAIALQKALFTSCEREKCKEEVMYSLRKQHKRTMQELSNIRELYDRLSRDTTLYHLSVKDRDSGREVKKREEVDGASKKYKGDHSKHDDDTADKRRQDSRRRHDSSISKLKHLESSEQSFLVKETKERRQSREEKSTEKNTGKINEKNIDNCGELKGGKNSSSKYFKGKADEVVDHHASKLESIAEVSAQKLVERISPNVVKNEQQMSTSAKLCHTTMCRNAATITSSTSLFSEDINFHKLRERKLGFKMKSLPGDSKCCSENQAVNYRNMSKNASRMTSNLMTSEVQNAHDMSVVEQTPDVGGDSSSDASNIVSPSRFDDELTPADSDGMCHELQRDISQIQHLDKMSPMMGVSGFESRNSRTSSNSLTAPKKSSFLKKDKKEIKTSSTGDDEALATPKQNARKKAVEFDANEEPTKSTSAETHSLYLGPDSEMYSPPTLERRPCLLSRCNTYTVNQSCAGLNCQSNKQLPGAIKEDVPPQQNAEAPNTKSHSLDNAYFQGRERYQHDGNRPELKQDKQEGYSYKNSMNSVLLTQNSQIQENVASQWNIGCCSQCKAQNKSYCNCSNLQRNHTAFAYQNMATYEKEVPHNDLKYPWHGRFSSVSTKLTFNEIDSLLEYNSSLSRPENLQVQSVERNRMQACSSPDEDNNATFHGPDQKSHLNILDDEPTQGQTMLVTSLKISGHDLPERITTYLANCSSVRREMSNNNNSASNDSQMDRHLHSGCRNCEHEQNTPVKEDNLVNCDSTFECNGEDVFPHSALKMSADTEHKLVFNDEKVKIVEGTQNQAYMQKENELQEATEKNKKDSSSSNCLPESSYFQIKPDSSRENIDVLSEPNENINVLELMPDTGCKNCGPKSTSCHSSTKLITKPPLCSEASVLNKGDENLRISIFDIKANQAVGFPPAVSVPAYAGSLPSLSTREPSLYKHLSLIHFSEKTRRYEWLVQPVLSKHKPQKETLLDGTESRDQKPATNQLSDLRSHDATHKDTCQLQDSFSVDVVDSRSDSQSSDSGHFSLSGRSTYHSSHNEKPLDCGENSSGIYSSNVYKPQKTLSVCSKIANHKITDLANKNVGQSVNHHNQSNNNNNVSNLKSSFTENVTCQHSPVRKCHSHVSFLPCTPVMKLDSVVKKLDFSDSTLEENEAKNESLDVRFHDELCFTKGNEGKVQDRITSEILPFTTESLLSLQNKSGICEKPLSVIYGNPEGTDPGVILWFDDQNPENIMNIANICSIDDSDQKNETFSVIKEGLDNCCQDMSCINQVDFVNNEGNVFYPQNVQNRSMQNRSKENEKKDTELNTEEHINNVSYFRVVLGEDSGEGRNNHRTSVTMQNRDVSSFMALNKDRSPMAQNKHTTAFIAQNKDRISSTVQRKDRISAIKQNKDGTSFVTENQNRTYSMAQSKYTPAFTAQNKHLTAFTAHYKDRTPIMAQNDHRTTSMVQNKDRTSSTAQNKPRTSSTLQKKDRTSTAAQSKDRTSSMAQNNDKTSFMVQNNPRTSPKAQNKERALSLVQTKDRTYSTAQNKDGTSSMTHNNHRKTSHQNEGNLSPEKEDNSKSGIEKEDHRICWNSGKDIQILKDGNIGQFNSHHFNITFQRQAEQIFEDTRDSNGSEDCLSTDMQNNPSILLGFEKLADKFDDKLSTFNVLFQVSKDSVQELVEEFDDKLSKLNVPFLVFEEITNKFDDKLFMPNVSSLIPEECVEDQIKEFDDTLTSTDVPLWVLDKLDDKQPESDVSIQVTENFVKEYPEKLDNAPVWKAENYGKDMAEKVGDSLPDFLESSVINNESVMGSALSPVSRLYRLLVESQQMINSLQSLPAQCGTIDLQSFIFQVVDRMRRSATQTELYCAFVEESSTPVRGMQR